MTGLSAWAAFYFFATNQEKISSSIVIQVLRTVRGCEDLRDVLGEAIRPEPVWWLNGDPWIHGSVRTVSLSLSAVRSAGK
jgi:cytochrome c oxidase assembly factor 1